MSTNPFGEAPPTKPARTARPPPTNPFGGPIRQPSHDGSKSGAKNPFAQSSDSLSMSVPSSTPSSSVVTPVVPTTVPPVPSPMPSLPSVLETFEVHDLPPPIPDLPPSTPTSAPPLSPPPLPPIAPSAEPETPTHAAPLPPPVPAVRFEPPTEVYIHNDDGFGFEASHTAHGSDPFASASVASHDFAATTSSTHFNDDDFHVSFPTLQKPAAVEEPIVPPAAPAAPPVEHVDESSHAFPREEAPEDANIHILAPPPPQTDDDPYEIHINKPLPTAPPAPAASTRPIKHEEAKSKPVHKDGDPFSELVEPLKPKHVNPFAPKPVNPADSMSLNALMATKTQQKTPVVDAKTLVIPTVPSTTAVVPAAKEPVKEFVIAPATTTVKPSVSQVDPFAVPTTSSGVPHADDKDFDLFQTSPAPAATSSSFTAVPGVTPSITPADFDIFAPKPKPAVVPSAKQPVSYQSVPFDPFATSQPPVAATAVSDDTFDVFGVPQRAGAVTNPASKSTNKALSTPPPPAIANKTTAHNSQKPLVPPLQTSHPHDHLPTKQATTPSVTVAPPLPDFIFSPAEYRKSNSHSFDHTHLHDDDPFGVPTKSGTHPVDADDGDDDFFGSSSQSNAHFDQDPLARLKQSYGLSSTLHDHENNADHNFDDFDDFTFDQANHGGRSGDFSKAGKQPPGGFRTSGKSSNASSSSDILRDASGNKGKDENGVVVQGDILSRLSTKAMFTKDWHETYYAIIRDNLYVFRQRADYIQFQAQLQNRRERRGSTGEGQAPLYKKCFPLQYNIKLEPIKGKEYKGLGLVYNFSLEQLEDFGLQNLGKFGSTDRDAVQQLWDKIRVIVMEKRKERLLPKPQYG